MRSPFAFPAGFILGILSLSLAIFLLGDPPEKPGESSRGLPSAGGDFRLPENGFSASEFSRTLTPDVSSGGLEQVLNAFVKEGREDSCMMLLNEACTRMALPYWKKHLSHTDSMVQVLNWAEEVGGHVPRQPAQKILFEAIADFWFQTLAQRLDTLAQEEPGIKYTFRYRYLTERCARHNHLVNVPITRWEKGINRLLETRMGYVAGRLLLDVHPLLLILAGLFLIFTLVAWVRMTADLLNYRKGKMQNKKKHNIRTQ
jgi:hypothetical protein